jgi:hypothetical protein
MCSVWNGRSRTIEELLLLLQESVCQSGLLGYQAPTGWRTTHGLFRQRQLQLQLQLRIISMLKQQQQQRVQRAAASRVFGAPKARCRRWPPSTSSVRSFVRSSYRPTVPPSRWLLRVRWNGCSKSKCYCGSRSRGCMEEAGKLSVGRSGAGRPPLVQAGGEGGSAATTLVLAGGVQAAPEAVVGAAAAAAAW